MFGIVKEINKNKGFDKDNNGFELNSKEIDRLISVVPNAVQLEFSDIGYYSFIHYGMNTFTGKEWGSGKEDESLFNPENVDTDQWARVLRDSGSKAVIFTAKHHDGFCLFQTDYTNHSIKNSPYKNGRGDIVRELSESCKKYGLGFGIYLSPWDRNSPLYGTEAYNDFFVNQLTELCSNYGEIFCFWFDGAKGAEAPDFDYDWERYYDVIHTLQPGAIIANCGDDVRWIGNEAGKVRQAEWSVVPRALTSVAETVRKSQNAVGDTEKLQKIKKTDSDLGSREKVRGYKELVWYPAEADVSIHYDWFYNDKSKMRNAKQLSDIFFASVGGNASMLLNVPPSENGVIEEKDISVLKKFRSLIDETFKSPIEFSAYAGNADLRGSISSDNGSYRLENGQSTIVLKLNQKVKVKTIVLKEDISKSQRTEGFEIYAKVNGGYKKIFNGSVIGSQKIIRLSFPNVKNTDELRLVITQSRSNPYIRSVSLYK